VDKKETCQIVVRCSPEFKRQAQATLKNIGFDRYNDGYIAIIKAGIDALKLIEKE